MRNVVLARVDDRLIHGEIVSVWTPHVSANCILIADDEVANDAFNKRVVKALAPDGVKVFVCTVEQAQRGLLKPPVPGENVLVLAKTPVTYARLVREGVAIKEVNLGNVGTRGARKPFIKNVACDHDDLLAIKELIDAGVRVYHQLVPEQEVTEANKALAEALKEE